ncbi:MAG: hypothetical protein AAGJ93_11950 [Bacteroidota bacterium]
MYPQGNGKGWGTGIYYSTEDFCLELFDKPNGDHYGTLIKQGYRRSIIKRNGTEEYPHGTEFLGIGYYDSTVIKVKLNSNETWDTIFWKSNKEGLYVNRQELDEIGLFYGNYSDLLRRENLNGDILKAIQPAKIGVNLEKSCLRLREQASLDSEIITCIPGNDWNEEIVNHLEILSFNENWAKVKVTTLVYSSAADDSADGCGHVPVKEETGWVLAIDDAGYPNIWYAVSSY